ncbi:MAG: hypothetical protein FJ207_06355 [Gemmatimonadetes bacterium]|nr:hypothetical protein [Gemmatimonadota bacterium]
MPPTWYVEAVETLLWFEGTPPSIWMRESGPGFFGSLILHSLGMAFLVGAHVATDLRILGVAPGVPLSLLYRLRPMGWLGLGVVVPSGVLLLVAYPTKALTNPVFYVKLASVGSALLVGRALGVGLLGRAGAEAEPLPSRIKAKAGLSLLLWALAITSGRLLAYTYHVLLAADLYGP